MICILINVLSYVWVKMLERNMLAIISSSRIWHVNENGSSHKGISIILKRLMSCYNKIPHEWVHYQTVAIPSLTKFLLQINTWWYSTLIWYREKICKKSFHWFFNHNFFLFEGYSQELRVNIKKIFSTVHSFCTYGNALSCPVTLTPVWQLYFQFSFFNFVFTDLYNLIILLHYLFY